MHSVDNSSPSSSNMLVSPMQQYIQNLSSAPSSLSSTSSTTSTQPIFIKPINNNKKQQQFNVYSSSLPSAFYYGHHHHNNYHQSSPPNTQLLFSNNYFNPNKNDTNQQQQQQQSQYITNTIIDPINQLNTLTNNVSGRPITKRLTVSPMPININNILQSPPLSTASPSLSSFSPSPSSPFGSIGSSRRDSMSSTCSSSNYKRTSNNNNTKVLPIRSQAVDLTLHIENAKKLKEQCNKKLYCTFCKTNNETEEVYSSHLLKDSTGRVQCPILKLLICPICGESGEKAHTITYCKDFKKSKRIQMMQKAISKMNF